MEVNIKNAIPHFNHVKRIYFSVATVAMLIVACASLQAADDENQSLIINMSEADEILENKKVAFGTVAIQAYKHSSVTGCWLRASFFAELVRY